MSYTRSLAIKRFSNFMMPMNRVGILTFSKVWAYVLDFWQSSRWYLCGWTSSGLHFEQQDPRKKTSFFGLLCCTVAELGQCFRLYPEIWIFRFDCRWYYVPYPPLFLLLSISGVNSKNLCRFKLTFFCMNILRGSMTQWTGQSIWISFLRFYGDYGVTEQALEPNFYDSTSTPITYDLYDPEPVTHTSLNLGFSSVKWVW